jgi:hypothetical protein
VRENEDDQLKASCPEWERFLMDMLQSEDEAAKLQAYLSRALMV